MNKKMNNKGFSLVELIIVIAIMAVLIGVLAPQFIKYVEKSRESTDITNLDTCVSAVNAYYADKGIPTGGVLISINTTSNMFMTNVSGNALSDAGMASCVRKSDKWTGLTAVVKENGGVDYSGNATYYAEKTDKSGFDPK